MSRDPASRRRFLLSAGVFGAAAFMNRPDAAAQEDTPSREPGGAGALQRPGPPPAAEAEPVTAATFAEAERLAGISFTDAERELMSQTIAGQLALVRRRLEHPFHRNDLAPAMRFDPRLPGMDLDRVGAARQAGPLDRPTGDGVPLPERDEEIAYAPLTRLSQWIEHKKLTSERLTRIYLDRLKEHDEQLKCVITLTEDMALEQARRADEEISAGRWRGPLHGIPWGAKDLFDTAGIRTTWGAEPYVERVPERDAAVVRRLADAGAVLVAKLSLGALAYNDIWFGGRTRNPWNLEQGSSGSSAGSAAAVAAGLVGFALGTETYGSIVSPCMRCGTTGLRPTFGRVSRDGAMALCWSLDKVGPIARTVDDCLLVLEAINGYDPADPSSIDMPLEASQPQRPGVEEMRIGYNPAWFEEGRAHQLDREALEAMERLGARLVEVELPDWPYDTLLNILYCEAAASFEELTRTGQDDTLTWQAPVAWPNRFRQTWFVPGIELIQADRLRRRCMEMMAGLFEGPEAPEVLIGPSYAASLLLITNNTGHPSLTLRTGFTDRGTPHGITLIGRLFDEPTLCRAGSALERELDVWDRRPL